MLVAPPFGRKAPPVRGSKDFIEGRDHINGAANRPIIPVRIGLVKLFFNIFAALKGKLPHSGAMPENGGDRSDF